MHLPADCVCTSSDSVYPGTAVMANLMTYDDAVISEHCTVSVAYPKLLKMHLVK